MRRDAPTLPTEARSVHRILWRVEKPELPTDSEQPGQPAAAPTARALADRRKAEEALRADGFGLDTDYARNNKHVFDQMHPTNTTFVKGALGQDSYAILSTTSSLAPKTLVT